MLTIGERIRLIRDHFKLSQSKFAEVLECTQANISRYEKNAQELSATQYENIRKTYNISLDWLLTGQGSMFLTDQPKPELPAEDQALLDDAKQLVKTHCHDCHESKVVLQVYRAPYSGRHEESHLKDKEDAALGNVRELCKLSNSKEKVIPLYATKVCAGNGTFVSSEEIESYVDLYHEATKISDYVLTVVGDSMIYAGIYHGDKILVKTDLESKIGDFVIARIPNGELTLKRLVREGHEYFLEPANRHYYSILLTDDIKIIGVVKGVFRNC